MNKIELRNEVIKCGKDPVYFIKKYVKIKHPVKGLLPFNLWDFQEDLLHSYQDHRFNIVLKARQLGISETTAAYATWLMLFHREKNVIIIASKAETAKNIVRKIETALKKLPKWLQISDIVVDNRLSIELSNGSRCKAIATSEDAGRSEAVSFLIVDEAAFVPRFDELWTGLYSTVAAGGKVAILSTPNGVGNKFHQLYTDAEDKKNEFKHHKFMWWLHPERKNGVYDDPNYPGGKSSPWFVNEVKSANMSIRDIAQELSCEFNASGDTVLSPSAIKWVEECTLAPLEMQYLDRNLWVWMPAHQFGRYFVTADVARGDGKDYSAATVWDMSSMSEVAEYYGKVPVEEYAEILCMMGKKYNNALLVVENSSIGLAAIEHIRLKKYENVYYSRKGDIGPGEAINPNMDVPEEKNLVPGFTTSSKNRSLMIAKLEEYIRNQSIQIRSKRFHKELTTFIWDNGRAEAMSGKNDDLVMSAAIAVWIRDTFLNNMVNNVDMQKALVEGIHIEKKMNTNIEGASKDPLVTTQSDNFKRNYERQVRSMKLRLPHGVEIDFGFDLLSSG